MDELGQYLVICTIIMCATFGMYTCTRNEHEIEMTCINKGGKMGYKIPGNINSGSVCEQPAK